MIKADNTISAIKQCVRELSNQQITVKLNLGRNKFVTYPATLSGVYPSIFTVQPSDANFIGKTSFSYSEILCGRVRIIKSKDYKAQ